MKIDFDLNRIKALLKDSPELHSPVQVKNGTTNDFDPDMPNFVIVYEQATIEVGSDDDDESVFTLRDHVFLEQIGFQRLAQDQTKLNFAKETLHQEFGISISEFDTAIKYVDQFSEADVVAGILQMLDGFDWLHHYLMANAKLL